MLTANLHIIIGLGVTGAACLKYLVAQQIPVLVMDTRAAPPQLDWVQTNYPEVSILLGPLDSAVLATATTIIVSPGWPLTDPILVALSQQGKDIIGDVELFARQLPAASSVVAITGTNGKSTVTTLVGLILERAGRKVALGGNLGVPVLEFLADSHAAAYDHYVLELSSFQLETTQSLRPHVASILNVTPDHLDRYASFADYIQAKQRIYHQAAIAVSNKDDRATYAVSSPQYYFTLNEPQEHEFGVLTVDGQDYLAYGKEVLMPCHALPVPGLAYRANALAALAIGARLAVPRAVMLAVLASFTGLPHRCQLVHYDREITWYNDSKATNIAAAVAAIAGIGAKLKGRVILIAGGVLKEQDLTALVNACQEYVSCTILLGAAQQVLAEALAAAGSASVRVADLAEAVQYARSLALPGDAVLLSPACASYDMFTNFAERGLMFTQLVAEFADAKTV